MSRVHESKCDSRLLEQLVSNELPSSERQSVEEHVNHCERCAREISAAATIGWNWDTVKDKLTTDEFDGEDVAEIHSPASRNRTADRFCSRQGVANRDAVIAREISGWLDPTDDPKMMGRFAGYEIVGIVGHGGMGIVLKGFESSLNRYVAIKVLAPRLATNGAARKRFSREAQAAAAVRHDNVIAVHRVDEWHGLPFLVMPYVAGISLQRRMDEEGPLSLEAILRIGEQVASGLAAAHAQGLVHRDIKPANILLENGVERVTITDFGLARAVDDATITRTGIIAGTPQFMSPEQAQAKSLDHRSDVFSLGSVMYAMATGRAPFRSDDNHEILRKIVDDKARGVREVQPTVPEWLSEIIDWLHEKSAQDRPQTAEEVAELLESWLGHLQNPESVPAPDRPAPRPSARSAKPPFRWRRGLLAVVAGAIFLLAGVVIALETNKGTIRIESNVDDVPIIVTREGKVVDKLTVTQEGASVRLAAGQYRIQIGEGIDGVTIDGGAIVLRRGQQVVASVSATDLDADLSSPDILIAMPAELIAAVKETLVQMRSAHDRNRNGVDQWGDQLARIAMCEGHRTMRMASLESVDDQEAFGFTTPMYDPNKRALVVEVAFRKRDDDSWELVHLDVEPPDSAARDRESFRRTRPNAREHTVELAELQPEDVLYQARSANVEHAELTADELIGKWRVVSVTGSGRDAGGDEPIGGFVEFGTHTMATYQNENSPKSLLEYKLEPDGGIRLQLIEDEKLSEFIFAGRVQRRQDSLHLALDISVPSSQVPASADLDRVGTGVKYFHLIREPQTTAERLDCEKRDQMYLRLKNAKRQASPESIQADRNLSESLSANITGTVVEVGENGLVELSVGSDDGVSEGMWFAVLRGGNIVANARVKKLSQNHAMAVVEWSFNNSFVAPQDQIVELRSPNRDRRGRASNDYFGSVKVTRTEATINGVFRHPGKLILQIGDALPETELRNELELPVGKFVAEIAYVIHHGGTDDERPSIVMRVAKSKAEFENGEYMAVGTPLQSMNLAQDRRIRFRESSDVLGSSRESNKIVVADVILKSGGKIPVSLVAEQIVREEQADHNGLYRQIKQLSSRFRMVNDPKAIKSDPWGEIVEKVRAHRGHESVRFGVLYADDSSAVGFSIPIGHDDGESLGVRIAAGVKDGKWQITDIDVQPMNDSQNELRKFVEEHPNAKSHGTQLQDQITDLGSSAQSTYRSMSPKAPSDLSRLQGAWEMIKYTGADGKQDLKIDHQTHEVPFRIAINGNKFTGPYFPLPMLGGPRESAVELAPDKSPKEMRLITDLDDGTKEIAHLLYRFQGDKLELSFVDDEAYRLLPANFPNGKPTGKIATATFRRVDSSDGDSTFDSAINGTAKQFIRFWAEVPQETRYVELQHTFFKQMKEEITDAEVLSSSQGENADGEPMRMLLFRVEDQYFCMHTERDELRALYRILRVPGYGAGHKIAKRFPKMSPLYLQATGLSTILSGRTDVDAPSFPYRLVHQWGDSTDEVHASGRFSEELSIELLQKRVDLLAAAIATQGGSHEDLVRAGMDLKRAQIANSKSDSEKRKLLSELVTMYDQLIQFHTLEVDSPSSVSASGQSGRSSQASLASDLLLLKSERLGVLSERAAIPSSSTGLKPGVKFSVHLVGSEATATTTTLKDGDSDEQLHLINPPIISSKNILSAVVNSTDDGQVSLDVTVDQDGGQRMLGATSKPKMRLAIVVNGKVVSSPIAHAPIRNHFSVTGKQSREYWEQFITTPPASGKPKLEGAK